MRLDAYTHFIPKPFVDKMSEVAGQHTDIGKRMRGVPAIYDLDVRKKVVDSFPDYAQILTYPMPPLPEPLQSPGRAWPALLSTSGVVPAAPAEPAAILPSPPQSLRCSSSWPP